MANELEDMRDRLQRLESLEEIRQLVSKYALALDMRDMDAMANLFVPDVKVGQGRSGRQAEPSRTKITRLTKVALRQAERFELGSFLILAPCVPRSSA